MNGIVSEQEIKEIFDSIIKDSEETKERADEFYRNGRISKIERKFYANWIKNTYEIKRKNLMIYLGESELKKYDTKITNIYNELLGENK